MAIDKIGGTGGVDPTPGTGGAKKTGVVGGPSFAEVLADVELQRVRQLTPEQIALEIANNPTIQSMALALIQSVEEAKRAAILAILEEKDQAALARRLREQLGISQPTPPSPIQ